MFRRTQPKSLELVLDREALVFASPAELNFGLAGRAGMPLGRVMRIIRQPTPTLLREAERGRRVATRFRQILASDNDGANALSTFLASLDRGLVTQDHGWRDIFSSLREFDSSANAYKRVAVERYLDYLSAREEFARSIIAEREAASAQRGREVSPMSASQTMVAESSSGELAAFERLPKGETIEVSLEESGTLPLMLVRHRCEIRAGGMPVFVDSTGHVTEIGTGKLIVGRDVRSDITVATERRDISRRHLIVEAIEGDVIRLTDISSLGTFVPPYCLDRTGT